MCRPGKQSDKSEFEDIAYPGEYMLPGVVCSVDLAGSVGEEVGLGAVGVGEEGLAEGQ